MCATKILKVQKPSQVNIGQYFHPQPDAAQAPSNSQVEKDRIVTLLIMQ